jgi:hypothetical protein
MRTTAQHYDDLTDSVWTADRDAWWERNDRGEWVVCLDEADYERDGVPVDASQVPQGVKDWLSTLAAEAVERAEERAREHDEDDRAEYMAERAA